MSATSTKRKRARRACVPCHKRKRKCDTGYPCGMCTTYEYNCRYIDEDIKGSGGNGEHAPPLTKRVRLDNESNVASPHAATPRGVGSQSRETQDPLEECGSSTKSPTVVADISTPTITSTGISEGNKHRSAAGSAVMAFPHILGVALGSDSLPKMQSYAHNFGIRGEEASNGHQLLGKLTSEEDLAFFSDVYFSKMAPIADYMDPKIYAQRCRDYYHGSGNNIVIFGAIAAGVAALGSFLSPNKHPQESKLVQHAKAILDDPAAMRMQGVDHIIAWAMRVFYLRATTSPTNSWIASCTAMHLCEAIGLHEEENIKIIAARAGAVAIGHDADRLRRIFWISWAGHTLLSYEGDRSPVQFRSVTCQPVNPISGSVADQFVRMAQIIPSPNSPFQLKCQPSTPREELFERLKELDKVPLTHPFLVVTKADLAFCLYRRIYQLKTGISDEIIQLIIDSGNAAVEAAVRLADQGQLFWNVIGSVFQYACVLLAIDKPTAHVHIVAIFRALESFVRAADTGLTREALSVARHLLNLSIAKKQKELTQLEAVEMSCQSFQAQPESDVNAVLPDTGWLLDWDQFLIEPNLPMFDSYA